LTDFFINLTLTVISRSEQDNLQRQGEVK